ncbi:hypothetical protein [Anaerotruncus massiliensis (ex Liu et al. 2021)]|uniref:hypothetical protein n=1 Tax=Anaerotruncus massiliensis (ex Liu et al. 2021) TaxID=2321404 RepID=UPI002672B145|nr:hypothetical protein [uncultured Anaerotruncus sp.]
MSGKSKTWPRGGTRQSPPPKAAQPEHPARRAADPLGRTTEICMSGRLILQKNGEFASQRENKIDWGGGLKYNGINIFITLPK